MKITEHVVDEVVVLEIEGRMTIEARDSALSTLVRECLADGHRALLLDLGGVPYADSRGLSELVVAQTTAEGADARLRLVGLRPHVRELLNTAGLSSLFETFDSVTDGVASFRT